MKHPHQTPAVDAATALEMVRAGAFLVDVREQEEWDAGHAPEAVHVPLGRFVREAPQLVPADRDVVVVCRSGNRSQPATDFLRDLGVEAVNLAGGMHDWVAAGGGIVDSRGGRGTVA